MHPFDTLWLVFIVYHEPCVGDAASARPRCRPVSTGTTLAQSVVAQDDCALNCGAIVKERVLDAFVIGESLIDIVEDPTRSRHTQTPGGSPLNVAIALARLGFETALRTQLGDDRYGQTLRNYTMAAGVSLVEGIGKPALTSTATAILDPDGTANYTFDFDWSITPMGSAMPKCRVTHAGSMAAYVAPGAQAVFDDVKAARSTSLISFDPNIRPGIQRDRRSARATTDRFVELADVVKASDADIRWLYPEENVESVLERWLARGAGIAVATLGASGAIGLTTSSRTVISAIPASVVDTVGAGDSYMAGLIVALAGCGNRGVGNRIRAPRLGDPGGEVARNAMLLAARCAAITVSRPGADPPSLTELLGEEASTHPPGGRAFQPGVRSP